MSNVMGTGRRSRRMHRHLLWAAMVCGLIGTGAGPVSAETLQEALGKAYTTNPTLDAARAQLRAVDERVSQALSGYRPRVEGSGSAGVTRTDSSSEVGTVSRSVEGTQQTRGVGLSVVQPIYRGGQTVAAVRTAESQVQAQRAVLLETEQRVLLDAARAYMDVVTAQAIVQLNINNEQVLRRQLEAARDRFRVGEITRTDVSQAESRLAGATASRVNAEGQLSAARAVFARVVGDVPGTLAPPAPKFDLPTGRDEAVELARTNNPGVVAATFSEAAARSNIDRLQGQRLPEVTLRAGVDRDWTDLISGQAGSSLADSTDRTSASVTANLRIPLYQGGAVSSQIREAKQTASRAQILIEDERRQASEEAIRAWEGLVTARASIQSRQAQVKAAEIALEGVRQEAQVGSRTVLDVLDAEQELLSARVALVRSQREEVVSSFTLLSAIGRLTAQNLALPVKFYDYEAYYRTVRDKWWGTDIGQ